MGILLQWNNGNRIFRIKKDGTDKAILNYESSKFINIADGWLYFIVDSASNRLFKMKSDGTKIQMVEKAER